jgi:hypothetical protein
MQDVRMRPSAPVVVVVAFLAAATIVASAASDDPSRAGCGTWRRVAAPESPGVDRFLFGVDASSGSDAWAVGSVRRAGGHARALALHWDGEAWSTVPTPGGRSGDVFLNAVAVVSPADAWAAGLWRSSDGLARTLVIHWDGEAWSLVDSPNPGDGEHVLSSASATRADDVWFAGYSRRGSAFRSLILHWDGTGLHATYPAGPVAGRGQAIGAVSSAGGTAIAVGGRTVGGGGTEPLVLRWDGAAWRREAAGLSAEHGTVLAGVAASPTGDAWVVGGYPGIGTSAAFAAGYDGSSWTTFGRRSIGTGDSFSGVAAFDGGAWAVGSYVQDHVERTLIELGEDGGWRRVPSPNLPSRDNHLLDVTALGNGEAWAVGSTTDANRRERPLIAFFCPS